MIFYTSYYIILGKPGIAILLALLAKRVFQGTWTSSILASLAGGVGIFLCYAPAYTSTDGLIPRPRLPAC